MFNVKSSFPDQQMNFNYVQAFYMWLISIIIKRQNKTLRVLLLKHNVNVCQCFYLFLLKYPNQLM